MSEQHITKSRKLEHWQIIAIGLMICDFLTIQLSYFLALWVRFDCVYSSIPERYLSSYLHFITAYSIGAIIFFSLFRMYRSMWRYVSYVELLRMFMASAVASIAHAVLITALVCRMPLSYYLWGSALQFVFLVIPRFSYRLLLLLLSRMKYGNGSASHVMIIGAGQAGQMLLRDLKMAKEVKDRAVCFIDDNPNKWGRSIDGVPIVGDRVILGHTKKKPVFMRLSAT